MVVGASIRGKGRKAADACRVVSEPETASGLYFCGWREGIPQLPRRPDGAALARRFSGRSLEHQRAATVFSFDRGLDFSGAALAGCSVGETTNRPALSRSAS